MFVGIQTPTNCGHRADGGVLNLSIHPPVVQNTQAVF